MNVMERINHEVEQGMMINRADIVVADLAPEKDTDPETVQVATRHLDGDHPIENTAKRNDLVAQARKVIVNGGKIVMNDVPLQVKETRINIFLRSTIQSPIWTTKDHLRCAILMKNKNLSQFY